MTLAAAAEVTATFTLVVPLAVTTVGPGVGVVASSLSGVDCGPTCAAEFEPGTAVSLVAAPAVGSWFGAWTGACTGSDPTCVVVMDQPRAATAIFYPSGDADGDGIDNVTEIGADPVVPADTDGDGIPDYLDPNADGDTILDADEGAADRDRDGIGNWLDLDADGD